jgi:hypothetical protein
MPSIINASTSNGLIQSADTSGTLQLQSAGTTKFTVDSTGAYGQLQLATAQSSTSGTSIDFTSIPSWVKKVIVMFSDVSTSGTSAFLVQIGSGSVTTTGYKSGSGGASVSSNTSVGTNSTTGFIVNSPYAAGTNSGIMTLALISSNTWVESHSSYTTGGALTFMFAGGGTSSALSGSLDRIRITTANGTDTFDAGLINIMYEG